MGRKTLSMMKVIKETCRPTWARVAISVVVMCSVCWTARVRMAARASEVLAASKSEGRSMSSTGTSMEKRMPVSIMTSSVTRL